MFLRFNLATMQMLLPWLTPCENIGVNRQLVQIPIGNQLIDTYLIEYEAKLNATDPSLRFFQTYATKGSFGYIILAAASTEENQNTSEALLSAVKSFRVN